MTTTQQELLEAIKHVIETLPEDVQFIRDDQWESGSRDMRIIDLISPSQDKFSAQFDIVIRRQERTNRYISEV